MRWEPVNAMTFESATHRVRRVDSQYWIAERKAVGDEPLIKIGKKYFNQFDAEKACEADAYKLASGH